MSDLNKKLFPEYTVNHISTVMSLRKPQKQSVKKLDEILDEIELTKTPDLVQEELDIHTLEPLFKEFEHDFPSLTFALATGVGKTKLMGAFITYLYTNKGIKNFFIVAPNLTIYSKLKNDLGNPDKDNEKYVFRGVSCFAVNRPNVSFDDDYKDRHLGNIFENDKTINIYIYNISKFNSDERNIKALNEVLGQSFFNYLQSLDDLVVIMDESHHYRAKNSSQAINDLHPVLGLELTATPQVQSGSKTVLFKNVVYEYPLSAAIRDGYTRTPYALTRMNIKNYSPTEEEMDKIMLTDGIKHHENMKKLLKQYAVNHAGEPGVRLVKPFMLVVCKDTNHAQQVLDYVKSLSFRDGYYADKVIMVHSNQSGAEKEENIQQLLEVEKTDNPVEIVIHVNILKEGWDVNNLYTIVPLRTATSKTLREQTVGRGLRLPFGARTGDNMLDSVTITAHDKFEEIIAEAQRGDSIFKADGVIYADHEKEKEIHYTEMNILDEVEDRGEILTNAGLDINNEEHKQAYNEVAKLLGHAVQEVAKTNVGKKITKEEIKEKVIEDLGKRYEESQDVQAVLDAAFDCKGDEIVENAKEKTMYIPKIRTESFGDETYIIQDFELDLTFMSYVPIENEILIKNLLNSKEKVTVLKGDVINFDSIKPEKVLVDGIREISEIDYEKCPQLIQKVVMQFLNHYRSKFTEEEVKNICLMYRRDIISKFKEQLLQHLAVTYNNIKEVAYDIDTVVTNYGIDTTEGLLNINEKPEGKDIRSVGFYGASKALLSPFRFDSEPERLFALACENSDEVKRWLRPAATQFNITYNHGRRYEPDFVVETDDMYYLVEVKDKTKLHDPDVIAKADRAYRYCKIASDYNKANGHKGFEYLFIPHDQISSTTKFNNLKDRFSYENIKKMIDEYMEQYNKNHKE